MFIQEMKRRLFTKYVLFSVIGVLLITLGLNFILINDEKDINYKLKQQYSYKGDIKEDELLTALKKVRDEKSEDLYYKSQLWIVDNLVNTYPGILYTENKLKDFPDKLAKNFYKCWKDKFQILIKKLPISQQEIAMEKLNEIKIPFKQYSRYYIYKFSLENMKIIFMLILFLVTFFEASTYSDSFEDGSMEIIMATKGYKKNMIIRILPVIVYGILLTLIAVIGTVGITSSLVGFQTLKSSFKVIALFSFGNFTIGQVILIMTISEIIGMAAISTLMGYVSFKIKKTTTSIAIGVGLNIFYIIGGKFMLSSTNIINYLLNGIPMSTSQILSNINSFSITFGLWEPFAIIIEVAIVFLLSFIALIVAINKKNIKI